MKSKVLELATFSIVLLVMAVFSAQEADACNYKAACRRFDRAVASGSPGKICGAFNKLIRKFGVTKALPPGIVCNGGGGGAPGRGGGPGGVGPGGGGPGGSGPGGGLGPAGGPVNLAGWVRNFSGTTTSVSWSIVPVAGNPRGFKVPVSSGIIAVPPNSTSMIPFSVNIDTNVRPGKEAFFDIFMMDMTTGLPYSDEYSRFKVVSTNGIEAISLTPMNYGTPGVPLKLSWLLRNSGNTTQTVNLSWEYKGDPSSKVELNNGYLYDIKNYFKIDKSARVLRSNTATLDPGEEMIIEKEALLPGEYCDPNMLSCCHLFVETADAQCAVGAVLANSHDVKPYNVDQLTALTGQATGGEVYLHVLTEDGETWTLSAKTEPGDEIASILDDLATQVLEMAESVDNFNFAPIVSEDTIFLMHSPHSFVEFTSADEGLYWELLPDETEPHEDPIELDLEGRIVTLKR